MFWRVIEKAGAGLLFCGDYILEMSEIFNQNRNACTVAYHILAAARNFTSERRLKGFFYSFNAKLSGAALLHPCLSALLAFAEPLFCKNGIGFNWFFETWFSNSF